MSDETFNPYESPGKPPLLNPQAVLPRLKEISAHYTTQIYTARSIEHHPSTAQDTGKKLQEEYGRHARQMEELKTVLDRFISSLEQSSNHEETIQKFTADLTAVPVSRHKQYLWQAMKEINGMEPVLDAYLKERNRLNKPRGCNPLGWLTR